VSDIFSPLGDGRLLDSLQRRNAPPAIFWLIVGVVDFFMIAPPGRNQDE